MLTDPADQSVSVAARPSTAAWRSSTSKHVLRRPSSLANAMGDPGSWSGLTKLASSTPAPPLGGRSMTISVREFGMPMTVAADPSHTTRTHIAAANVVERGFNQRKQWRGLATRYRKLALTY